MSIHLVRLLGFQMAEVQTLDDVWLGMGIPDGLGGDPAPAKRYLSKRDRYARRFRV